jgi:hypothetical protein
MRQSVFQFLAAAAIGALLAFPSALAFAKTVAECNAEDAASKAAIRASNQTKKDFVAACRAVRSYTLHDMHRRRPYSHHDFSVASQPRPGHSAPLIPH